MILDNETQRKFLLELMQQVSFPGTVLDLAYITKIAIAQASLGNGNSVNPLPRYTSEELARASDDS
jgi:hypothetical protein